jgi:hypothetical protein
MILPALVIANEKEAGDRKQGSLAAGLLPIALGTNPECVLESTDPRITGIYHGLLLRCLAQNLSPVLAPRGRDFGAALEEK